VGYRIANAVLLNSAQMQMKSGRTRPVVLRYSGSGVPAVPQVGMWDRWSSLPVIYVILGNAVGHSANVTPLLAILHRLALLLLRPRSEEPPEHPPLGLC
jgi:hypothetical protein